MVNRFEEQQKNIKSSFEDAFQWNGKKKFRRSGQFYHEKDIYVSADSDEAFKKSGKNQRRLSFTFCNDCYKKLGSEYIQFAVVNNCILLRASDNTNGIKITNCGPKYIRASFSVGEELYGQCKKFLNNEYYLLYHPGFNQYYIETKE